MKIKTLIVIFIGINNLLYAQYNLSQYNLRSIPQHNQLNPGLIPNTKSYLQLPILPNIKGGIGLQGFLLDDLGYIPEGEYQAIFAFTHFNDRLKGPAGISGNLDWTILGWGSTSEKSFINFGLTNHIQLSGMVDKEAFRLFADAEELANGNRLTLPNSKYNLDETDFTFLHYYSLNLGYARNISEQFSLGINLKYLVGLSNLKVENQALKFETFAGTYGFASSGNLNIKTAGLNRILGTDGNVSINQYLLNFSNNGFAFDIGGKYQPNDQLQFSASIINIGGINWKQDLNEATIDATRIEESFEEIGNLIEEASPNIQPFRTRMPTQAFIATNYYIKPSTSVGLVVSPSFLNGTTDMSAAFSFNTQWQHFIGLTGNLIYTDDQGVSIGGGASINFGGLQFYAIMDNIGSFISPRSSHTAHLSAGINIIAGRRKKITKREKSDESDLWEQIVYNKSEEELDEMHEAKQEELERTEKERAKIIATQEKEELEIEKPSFTDRLMEEKQKESSSKKCTRER